MTLFFSGLLAGLVLGAAIMAWAMTKSGYHKWQDPY